MGNTIGARLMGWVDAVRDRVAAIRDPEQALCEILPRVWAEAYAAGRAWGRAEGRADAARGHRATLETLLAGIQSPANPCPACSGRGCVVCSGTGNFPEKPGKDPAADLF